VTSPEGVPSTTAGGVTWTASNSQQQIGVFRGESPQDFFNCLAPADVPGGTTQNANGSWNIPASDTQTSSGSDAIDPNVPSWTNCQLRVSSNNAAVTSDQAFDTLSLQSGPTGSVPETPYAVLLPIGAVAVLGGGVVIMRRRRKSHAAA
jgi:hypothetical protein